MFINWICPLIQRSIYTKGDHRNLVACVLGVCIWAFVKEIVLVPDYQVDFNSPVPRYYQVYVSLEDRIRSGEFAPGDPLPSERQLAKDYGVSRITIVKSIDLLVDEGLIESQHGRGNFVLDYSAINSCAAECPVAFCVPTPSESYIFSTLIGATRVAMEHQVRLNVVVIEDSEDGSAEARQLRRLVDSEVEGIILLSQSTAHNRDVYQEIVNQQFPFVMIDRYCPGIDVDHVIFDDERAGYNLTKLLIERGHQRIAILPGTEYETTSVQARLKGYKTALCDHNLPFNQRWVCDNIFEVLDLPIDKVEDLRYGYLDFIKGVRRDAPTAVFAINNYIAEQMHIDLMKIQMKLMQSVIDDQTLSVDVRLNIDMTTVTHKQIDLDETLLTGIALQNGEKLGREAMSLLINRIDRVLEPAPQHVEIPMQIAQIPRQR
jgi:GntR family transcriptional regulator, arabinose operon transcriptional repressor